MENKNHKTFADFIDPNDNHYAEYAAWERWMDWQVVEKDSVSDDFAMWWESLCWQKPMLYSLFVQFTNEFVREGKQIKGEQNGNDGNCNA